MLEHLFIFAFVLYYIEFLFWRLSYLDFVYGILYVNKI